MIWIVLCFFFFLMIRRPSRSTRTDTLFPYTTLFRSLHGIDWDVCGNLCQQFVVRPAIEVRLLRDQHEVATQGLCLIHHHYALDPVRLGLARADRKSTRLNSSH